MATKGAPEQTSLDDLRWLSQIDASQNHAGDDEHAFLDFQRYWEDGSSKEVSIAIGRSLICATVLGRIPYSDAQVVLNEARSQIQLSYKDDLEIKEFLATAAARFAATEYARGRDIPGMFDWASEYYAEAELAERGRPVNEVGPSALQSARARWTGLLALLAGDPERARQLGEQAKEYALTMQPEPDTDSADYRKLVVEQLDRAQRLLELTSSYPDRNNPVGNMNQTWHGIMRRLLGNPDMPDETNRQS